MRSVYRHTLRRPTGCWLVDHWGVPVGFSAECRNIFFVAEDLPDHQEPRVLKLRRHHYPLMQEPRQTLRDRLLAGKAKK